MSAAPVPKITQETIEFIEQFTTIVGVKPGQTAANIKDGITAGVSLQTQDIVNAVISTEQTILALATSFGKSVVPVAGYTVGLASLANNVYQIKGQLDKNQPVSISLVAQALSDTAGLLSSVAFTAATATALTPAGPVLAAVGGGLVVVSGLLTFTALAAGNNTLPPSINAPLASVNDALNGFYKNFAGSVSAGIDLVSAKMGSFLDSLEHGILDLSLGMQENFNKFLDDFRAGFHQAETTRSPLVLDLDGNGVGTLGTWREVNFDHNGDGFAERTGWVDPNDGMLVFDRNANGKIDNGAELFGNHTRLPSGAMAANGFQALASHDGNADGKIDAADKDFAAIKVWKDADSDGVADAGELVSLASLGIKSIGLGYKSQTVTDKNGNQHLQTGQYEDSSGKSHAITDVWYAVDTARTVEVGSMPVDADVAALPDIAGFGTVRSLHRAMTGPDGRYLQELVRKFVDTTDPGAREPVLAELIYVWAGVRNVDPASRAATQIYGNAIGDARKLAALERFLGEDYVGTWCWGERDPNPHGPAAKILLSLFGKLEDYVWAQLLLQTQFRDLSDSVALEWNAKTGKHDIDATATVALLKAAYDANPQQGILQLAEFAASLKLAGDFGAGVSAAVRAGASGGATAFDAAVASFGLSNLVGTAADNHLSGTDSVNDMLYGFGGNDDLSGGGGNDLLDGGTGNDYLQGGAGADAYVFNRGWGKDIIFNSDTDAVGVNRDKIVFGAGILPAEVIAKRSGFDLILSLERTTDTITVFSYFDADGAANYAVETIEFADGTVWDLATVKTKVLAGTMGNDSIAGYAGADRLAGLDGNDTLRGWSGGDTLIGGNGADTLYGDDGNDLVAADAGEDTLYGGNGDDILSGGTGDDDLSGDAGADRLDGGAGRDTLSGGAGADTYLFGKGSGQDTLNNWDNDTQGTNADKVLLGAGIAATGVTLLRAYGHLVLKIDGTDDQLTIRDYFDNEGTTGAAVETIQFADGTVWNLATIKAKALAGSAGSDTLTGYAGADRLAGLEGNDMLHGLDGDDTLLGGGGADALYGDKGNDTVDGEDGNDDLYGGDGDDVLSGGSGRDDLSGDGGADRLDGGRGDDVLGGGGGADTYLFGKGSGHDRIRNYDNDAQGTHADKVLLGAGVAASGVTLVRAYNSLVLKINGTDDQLTIDDYFYDQGRSGGAVETIQFADGTVWDVSAVMAKVLAGTAGNDEILGYAGADRLAGLDGNDTLRGWDGNDTLLGGSGADTLQGEDGNDAIAGDAGNDRLYGGSGNDGLNGGSGIDTLYGDMGADRLDGGAGRDTLVGGDGADTYLFGKGSGQDTINNYDYDKQGTNADKVLLGAGVATTGVTVLRSNSDLVLKIDGTDDALTIQNYFAAEGAGNMAVETIQFADGTVWDVATVKTKALAGSTASETITGYASADRIAGLDGNDTIRGLGGNDTLLGGNDADRVYGDDGDDTVAGEAGTDILYGGGGNDVLLGGSGDDNLSGDAGADRLDGGAGRDTLSGGAGADTYLFGKGSGQDAIGNYDSDTQGTNADKVLLGAGIATTGVTLLRMNDDLVLRINGTDDQLRIGGYFYNDGANNSAVETIEFADGTVWDLATVKTKVLAGTAGNDTIAGYAGADRLAGLDGNDTLRGWSGNDTLLGGGGADTLYGDEGNDIVNGEAGDDALYGGNGGDILTGATGEDELYGDDGADRLDGGTGRDMLQGGAGADTYVFGKGSGQDTINNRDGDTQGTNADKVLLGAGIAATGVTLLRAYGDLVLKIDGTGDQLTIRGYFDNEGTTSAAVETIQFADGTVWDIAAVKTKVLTGSAGADAITGSAGADRQSGLDGDDTLHGLDGNDTLLGGNGADWLYGEAGNDAVEGGGDADVLYGGAGADRLDGGAGNDFLSGGMGADTYLFGKGSGRDQIDDADGDAQGTNADTILLGAGIAATGVTLSRSYNDLLLKVNGTDDQLTILGYFASAQTAVETIQFADGTVWDQAKVRTKVLEGSVGDDALTGFTGADRLSGFDGNDSLQGLEGNDILLGGNGADSLSGDKGDDILNGEGGNDRLSGGAGGDRLDGGAGRDTLNGGDGADVYLFGKGSGQDTIANYDSDQQGTSADKVLLGAGIAASGVKLLRSSNDLVLTINGTDDQLTIQGYFYDEGASNSAVETIQFADGTVWDVATVKTKISVPAVVPSVLLMGTAADDTLKGQLGNDSLFGDAGNDTLDGGAGNDFLSGGAGNDTYLFGLGSGKDVIGSYDAGAGKLDVVQLGAGILTTNLIARRDGSSLELSVNGRPDALQIDGYFIGDGAGGYQVEQIRFADGTIWDVAAIKSKVLAGTAETDVRDGFSTADVLTGLAGNDILRGGGGNDSIDGGTGDDHLAGDDGDDLLKGGAQEDLLHGGNGNDTLQGQDGNDRLYGDAGNDRLDGGAGSDVLDGGAGNDTYLFGLGSGKDTISAYDNGAGKLDAVQLGAGVLAANLSVVRDGGDLVLSIAGTADELRVDNYFTRDAAGGYQVEQIRFADGAVWDVAATLAKALAGTADNDILQGYMTADVLAGLDGDDNLYGGAGSDKLDGGTGSDVLDGGAGNDTYLFGVGSGKDSIDAYDTGVGKLDVVQLGAGVSTTNLAATRDNADLLLRIAGTADELRIERYFSNDAAGGYQVEQIKFADGTIWDVTAVKAKVLAATVDSDVRHGYATADVIAGLAGEDRLYGGAGNDSMDGGSGSDRLYGEDGNDLLKGGTQQDVLEGGGGNDILYGQDGDDILYGQDGNDKLDGGAGNDQLIGGSGNDVYVFGRGAGKDLINAYDTGVGKLDVVQLAAGVLTTDLGATRDGTDLVLRIAGTADELRIVSYFGYFGYDATAGYQVEQIRFADGTIWDVAAVKTKVLAATDGDDDHFGYATADVLTGLAGNDVLHGAAGNDNLDGGAGSDRLDGGDGDDVLKGGAQEDELDGGNGNDRLDGGAGSDTLRGGAGNDTYLFGLGSGRDTVITYDTGVGKLDVVQLGAGVLTTNVTVARDGLDLVLGIAGTDDALRLQSYFLGSAVYRVDQIRFADGTAWDLATITAKLAAPTAENDALSGSPTADVLVGMAGDDTLSGGAGNDSLDGGSGDDRLEGGDGDDVLKGGAQKDSLDGGNGGDVLSGQDGDDTLYGRDGNDRLDGGAGNDTLDGGAGNDTYLFGVGSGRDVINAYDTGVGKLDVVQLGAGVSTTSLVVVRDVGDLVIVIADTPDELRIKGYFDNEASGERRVEQVKFADGTIWDVAAIKAKVLAGTVENDVQRGYMTADTLVGLAGDDLLYGAGGNDKLDGGTGNDQLVGGDGDDVLAGGTQDDRLYGDNGNDTLQGQDGEDALQGGAGDDRLDGGAGNDTLFGGTGNDTYLFGLGSGKDSVDAYEYGVGKSDVVQLGAGVLTTSLAAVRAGNDLVLSIGDRSDELRIQGYFINDAGGGYQVEQIKFADGTIWDVAVVKSKVLAATLEDDVRFGYSTADTLSGLAGDDTLHGGAGNDKLYGGTGSDRLYGEFGDDVLDGGAQDDYLAGGDGNDIYIVDDPRDSMIEYERQGTDIVQSSLGYTLGANLENLTLTGSDAIDGTGNDLANKIVGNGGNNRIAGGMGADILTGGGGDDVFDVDAAAESGITGATWDVIADFVAGHDRIDLSTIDADASTAANDAFTVFIGSTSNFTLAGQLKFANGVLSGNTDADIEAEFAIQLTGISTLGTADIVL